MHSDVVQHAAAHAVGDDRTTDSRDRSETGGLRRVPLTSLSLQDERDVHRVALLDDDMAGEAGFPGFQSSV